MDVCSCALIGRSYKQEAADPGCGLSADEELMIREYPIFLYMFLINTFWLDQ